MDHFLAELWRLVVNFNPQALVILILIASIVFALLLAIIANYSSIFIVKHMHKKDISDMARSIVTIGSLVLGFSISMIGLHAFCNPTWLAEYQHSDQFLKKEKITYQYVKVTTGEDLLDDYHIIYVANGNQSPIKYSSDVQATGDGSVKLNLVQYSIAYTAKKTHAVLTTYVPKHKLTKLQKAIWQYRQQREQKMVVYRPFDN